MNIIEAINNSSITVQIMVWAYLVLSWILGLIVGLIYYSISVNPSTEERAYMGVPYHVPHKRVTLRDKIMYLVTSLVIAFNMPIIFLIVLTGITLMWIWNRIR